MQHIPLKCDRFCAIELEYFFHAQSEQCERRASIVVWLSRERAPRMREVPFQVEEFSRQTRMCMVMASIQATNQEIYITYFERSDCKVIYGMHERCCISCLLGVGPCSTPHTQTRRKTLTNSGKGSWSINSCPLAAGPLIFLRTGWFLRVWPLEISGI